MIRQPESEVIFYDCYVFKPILEDLKVEYPTFVDLCIMGKCDYNEKIKGIALIKAHKLLLEHHSIDNLPNTYNITSLKHHVCRKLFSIVPSITVIESGYLNIFSKVLMTDARQALEPFGHTEYIQVLLQLYGKIGHRFRYTIRSD